MKKNRVQVLCVFFVIFSIRLFAADYKNKTVMVDTPDVESFSNLSKKEKEDYQNRIKSQLEENLDDYFEMTITANNDESERLKKIAAKQESDNFYLDGYGPEVGNALRAYYVVRSVVSRTGKNYSLSVRFEDLTTSEVKSATSKNYVNMENLISHPGAVDDVTLSLSDRLGIRLSARDREKLETGTANWDNDEKLEDAQTRKAKYEQRMKELQAQANSILDDSDLGKTSKAELQRKIEAVKLKKEQADKEVQEYIKKKELQERELEDEKLRSLENRERINKLDRSIASVEYEPVTTQSIYNYYSLLEGKKRVLLNLESEIAAEKKSNDDAMAAEITKECNSIINAELRRGERDSSGNALKEVSDARKQKADEIEKEIRVKYAQRYYEWLDVQIRAEKEIVSDIIDGYEELSDEIFRFSSASNKDELHYTVWSYDGSLMGWPVVIDLYSEGTWLGRIQTLISFNDLYQSIEKKDPPKKLSDEYLDAIDIYTSLFVQERDLLNFVVEVTAKPFDIGSSKDNVPSRYKLTFDYLEVLVNLEDNNALLSVQSTYKQIVKEQESSKSWYYTFFSDQKDVSKIISAEISSRETERERIRKEFEAEENRKKAEEERIRKEEEKKAKAAAAKEKFISWQENRTGIFVNGGMAQNGFASGPVFGAEILYGLPKLPYVSFGLAADYQIALQDSEKFYYSIALVKPDEPLISRWNFVRLMAEGGGSVTLFGWLRPYLMIAAGYYNCSYPASAVIYEEDPRYGTSGTLVQGFSMAFEPGIDIKIKRFSVGFSYKLFMDVGAGFVDAYTLSIGFRPW